MFVQINRHLKIIICVLLIGIISVFLIKKVIFSQVYKQAALGHSFYWQIILFFGFLLSLLRVEIKEFVDLFLKKIIVAKKATRRWARLTIYAILILLCSSVFSIYLGSDWLNALFQQRITSIASLSTEQEKELKSMWSLMRSETDYRAICAKLCIYASKNNVSLPRR